MAEAYVNDEAKLTRQLVWMGILLRRSDTVSLSTKQEVGKKLGTYDKLWEEDPKIQKFAANHEASALRRSILKVVRRRFPGLLELAQQRTGQMQNVSELDQLIDQILDAPNEAMAQWYLNKPAA